LNFQDWQSLSIPPEQYTGAIALIQTIAQVTGTSEHDIMKHLSESFYSLGGTSLNSILVILKLRFKGFQIGKQLIHQKLTLQQKLINMDG